MGGKLSQLATLPGLAILVDAPTTGFLIPGYKEVNCAN
jgi:hypothetical protein